MNKNECPKCGSKNTARIFYGMPEFSDDLINQIGNGEIILGGCTMTHNSKDYVCNDCSFEWGEQTASKLKEIFDDWSKEEEKMEAAAIQRGPMKAIVNQLGWTKCPFCGTKFSTKSKMSWDGVKHNYCKTRLVLDYE